MQIIFERFYQMYGIRTYMGLAAPKIFPIRELPKNSVVHFLTDDEQEFPDTSSILLKSNSRRVLLKNCLELTKQNHSLGKLTTSVQNKVFLFLQSNKQFVNFLKPLNEAKEENQLVFCNYNLVKILYRYQESNKMTPYWKWFDRQETMWEEIENLTASSQRNHFYEFKIPMELPSRSRLNQHMGFPTQETAKRFDTAEARFLLDFWKWLDPEIRKTSTLSKITTEHLNKINIMFQIKDGRSAILNLGYMNSWIKGQPNQTDKKTVTGMNPADLRTLFLKFLMSLQNFNVEIEKASRESETKQEDDRQNLEGDPNGDSVNTDPVDESNLDDEEDNDELTFRPRTSREDQSFGASGISSNKNVSKNKKAEVTIEDTDDPEPLSLEETIKQLEKETEALDEMENLRERLRGETVTEATEYDPESTLSIEQIEDTVFRNKHPQESLIERLEVMVSKGNVTAADYRKILKTIEAQATKPDPYGSDKTLYEASTILPEDLVIDQKTASLKVDERILDTSMHTSVVENLDRDYVRKTMSKDILSSIMAVQGAGVIVTDIETEIQHSALGSFERHSISLKPLGGQSSTITVKIPKVEEDGTFKANGVRYHMRKQRVDAPIRKISPERVGLSSYYGKLFVFRSPKKSDNSLTPVLKHLTSASIGNVENITRVIPANVFDNKFEAPYVYNLLSNSYKGFELNSKIFGKLIFNFDHRSRITEKNSDIVKLIEKDGIRVVGNNANGNLIYVNFENDFFVKLKEGEQKLGNIFDLLDLDRTSAPIDPVMIKIMGNTIPIGIVIARVIGFKGLVKLLRVKYRLVKGRQQKNLQPFEYAISFKDYSFIFDRKDVIGTLVLAGFDVCSKQLKAFPVESYEIKEVYDELLEGLGCGVMTTRELDLLLTSYIDPITKGLLHEMKEPETFLALLIRSAELLTTYHHPNSQDLNFQNIRGYERFGGAIYRETIRSIRAFRNKNISGRSKVEMSPYAVWQGIMEDASVKTCEDINPIQNLKMHESVTFVGEGGRSKEAFMKDARAFNENDAGVISEASVDSGDVGINIFMSGNPRLKNLRGQKVEGEGEPSAGSYLSTSLLLAAGAQHDD